MDAELFSFIASNLKQNLLPKLEAHAKVHGISILMSPDSESVAGAMLLTYDHMLTLDVEVGFIWSARWSVAKMLVTHTTPQVVRAFCKLAKASDADLAPTVVLILRTWTIFGRRKMLGIGLIVRRLVEELITSHHPYMILTGMPLKNPQLTRIHARSVTKWARLTEFKAFSIINIVTMVAFVLLHAVLIKRILLNLRGAVPDDGPNDFSLCGPVTQPFAPPQQQHWPYLPQV
ncbi:hypothetical protein JB92DRAFT_2836179 [Gautieria morchelliformis]|nr:hypothetical protein JB92DRAFT_2836179 [Gautieria morchelliformis]